MVSKSLYYKNLCLSQHALYEQTPNKAARNQHSCFSSTEILILLFKLYRQFTLLFSRYLYDKLKHERLHHYMFYKDQTRFWDLLRKLDLQNIFVKYFGSLQSSTSGSRCQQYISAVTFAITFQVKKKGYHYYVSFFLWLTKARYQILTIQAIETTRWELFAIKVQIRVIV